MTWTLVDSLARVGFVGLLLSLSFLTGYWSAGVWTLLSTAVALLILGGVLTVHERYQWYPGLQQAIGGFFNGVLLGGITISLLGMVYAGAPLYMPFVLFAAAMVTTALTSRLPAILFSGAVSVARFVLGGAMLAAFLVVIGHIANFDATWLYFAYAVVGLTVLEQLNIKACKTSLLSVWVHILWNGIGLFATAIALLFLVAFPLNVMFLLTTPSLVGLIGLAIGGFFALSVYTRLRMRGVAGALAQKRLVGVGVLSVAAVFLSLPAALFVVACAVLLAVSLIFGDRVRQ